MRAVKKLLHAVVPAPLLRGLVSGYHFFLAGLSALFYGHPSRHLLMIGVTGTKGKSSTTEMINAILEEAGHTTALLNSIRIKVGTRSESNEMRMSMPGRFFIQRFLKDALRAGCDAVVLEMTSEGARQHRHRFIELDGFVFTNLAPEHIESHGSYEAYKAAKLELAKQLVRSPKRPRIMVANADDVEAHAFLSLPVEENIPFSLSAVGPWYADAQGGYFSFHGMKIPVHLPGEFSLKNALAAASVTHALGVSAEIIARALDKLRKIPGRAERIEEGQDFTVVVDYAHTPDSLKALYDAYGDARRICVMGATGGGRDTWKRPVMGKTADENCDRVILTNEDPYDEDPRAIVEALAKGMRRKPEIIMDRREAIRRGLSLARTGDAVLVTGKGTDPCICGPNGSKTQWSDAEVAREELRALLAKRV
jgi:UDP-N-acetylmuramoyl-L-alanyl-D-glutamate--2,6-diaminopimelate ligase